MLDPDLAIEVLEVLRARTGQRGGPLIPGTHFYDPQTSLVNEGVWHNCVTAWALACLHESGAEGRSQAQERAVSMSQSILTLNYDASTQTFRRRTHHPAWEHDFTKPELAKVWEPEFYTANNERRAVSQAAAVIVWSHLRSITSDLDRQYQDILQGLVSRFWNNEASTWQRTFNPSATASTTSESLRVVDQGLCLIALQRALVVYRAGDSTSQALLRRLVLQTRQTLRRRFKVGTLEQQTYLFKADTAARDAADQQAIGWQKGETRVAWHDIWAVIGMAVSSSDSGDSPTLYSTELDVALHYLKTMYCTSSAGHPHANAILVAGHPIQDADLKMDESTGHYAEVNHYTGDNSIMSVCLRLCAGLGVEVNKYFMGFDDAYEDLLSRVRKYDKLTGGRACAISNIYTTPALWANTEVALGHVLDLNDFVLPKDAQLWPVYMDFNATTPIHPEVAQVISPLLLGNNFGNPSSAHKYGRTTKALIDQARVQVAHAIHADPTEIIFTSGGTEANNHAITGVAHYYSTTDTRSPTQAPGSKSPCGKHIITSSVEHPAVMNVVKALQEHHGFTVTIVPVDAQGRVSVDQVKQAIRKDTILITIMHANNEVGTLQPISEIAAVAREAGVIMHTDASQSIGKVPIDVQDLGVDLLTIAGHKLYAPKGVGALYIRRGIALRKFHIGAGHESGWRAGTENILLNVALGTACQLVHGHLTANMKTYRQLRDDLHRKLQTCIPSLSLNGHQDHRLPNTLNVSVPGIPSHVILAKVQDLVAVSAGSACHAGEVAISPVLRAMGIDPVVAVGALRISVGHGTTSDEVDFAVYVISQAVQDIERDR